jgi:hypothetical protein
MSRVTDTPDDDTMPISDPWANETHEHAVERMTAPIKGQIVKQPDEEPPLF